MLRQSLKREGIGLCIRKPDGTFWGEQSLDGSEQYVIDATFIDDELITIIAATPKKLTHDIFIVLTHLVKVFDDFGLIINWQPGKTECIVLYNGKSANKEKTVY